MHVAICIVAYRNREDVVACLAALAQSTYTNFEVVICENGGAQAYSALAAALPACLRNGQEINPIQASGNLGYAGGINVCMRASSSADAWWILNPDTLPEPTALEALVSRLDRSDCDLVGGVLYGPDLRVQTLGGRWRPWLARAEAIGRGRTLSEPIDAAAIEGHADFVSGASMLVSKRFRDSVGEMREDYFLYCEEVEWCLRGIEKGMRIGFAPRARVLHHQGSTTGSALDLRQRPRLQVYLDERNKILVTRDRTPWRAPLAFPAALLFILMRYASKGALKQMTFGLRGWWDGVAGRRGAPSES